MTASSFAQRFNQVARPLIAAIHAETLLYNYVDVNDEDQSVELTGIFKRNKADGNSGSDGIGVQTYTGAATFVVLKSDLPIEPDDSAEFIRNGETWEHLHCEPQDEWTWILHLARPDADVYMPGRGG
ncbi:MAG: hypothetical protein HRU15_20230 [Planctomycetes bacterium]|nr:hypothetical protein [Planctomycetota bacterium]